MGHERVGFLPKTMPWREVVRQIAGMYAGENEISDIVRHTIQNVRSRFRNLHNTDGVVAAFKFLLALSIASRSNEPSNELSSLGILIPEKFTPLSLAKALDKWVGVPSGSLEYTQIARSAAVDVIGVWSKKNKPKQPTLFQLEEDPYNVWRKASDGAGFCEVARLFFAKFTERYLMYFLEREASATVTNLSDREDFQLKIENHLEKVSLHAFETAKITQSFAAGWFNKHAREKMPTEDEIKGFLALAFGKIRDELRREDEII